MVMITGCVHNKSDSQPMCGAQTAVTSDDVQTVAVVFWKAKQLDYYNSCQGCHNTRDNWVIECLQRWTEEIVTASRCTVPDGWKV
jgi:hypothetical protein